jgi:hypothetical protein
MSHNLSHYFKAHDEISQRGKWSLLYDEKSGSGQTVTEIIRALILSRKRYDIKLSKIHSLTLLVTRSNALLVMKGTQLLQSPAPKKVKPFTTP